ALGAAAAFAMGVKPLSGKVFWGLSKRSIITLAITIGKVLCRQQSCCNPASAKKAHVFRGFLIGLDRKSKS
ncbi:MAG: hypothetical protein WBD31_32480, partial [Rubripirellula sp.]